MASIYEGSFLTIAAVDSTVKVVFFLTVSPCTLISLLELFPSGSATSLKAQSTAFVQFLQPQSNDHKLHLHNAPLYQRGWVFQE